MMEQFTIQASKETPGSVAHCSARKCSKRMHTVSLSLFALTDNGKRETVVEAKIRENRKDGPDFAKAMAGS